MRILSQILNGHGHDIREIIFFLSLLLRMIQKCISNDQSKVEDILTVISKIQSVHFYNALLCKQGSCCDFVYIVFMYSLKVFFNLETDIFIYKFVLIINKPIRTCFTFILLLGLDFSRHHLKIETNFKHDELCLNTM